MLLLRRVLRGVLRFPDSFHEQREVLLHLEANPGADYVARELGRVESHPDITGAGKLEANRLIGDRWKAE